MRADFIRLYKSVHTWTGIVSGLALFIAFYAGALTMFKAPLTRWASPPAAHAAVPLADAPQLIARALAAHPEAAKGFRIDLRQDGDLPARMDWEVRDDAADDHDTLSSRHYHATLREDGAVAVEAARPAPVAEFIDVLHRVVGLPFDTDAHRWVMGVVAVLYALALISGVIVLLPSLVKDFFALRLGRNFKRMVLDAHNVVGIISLPFHVVMALTALIFAFHDGIYFLQGELSPGDKPVWSQPPPPADAPPRDPLMMLPPLELAARAQALSPGFRPTMLYYQHVTGPRAVARVMTYRA
jgi:uncharacterized iron-regulated membrane protein